jgi:hypothetical protein
MRDLRLAGINSTSLNRLNKSKIVKAVHKHNIFLIVVCTVLLKVKKRKWRAQAPFPRSGNKGGGP